MFLDIIFRNAIICRDISQKIALNIIDLIVQISIKVSHVACREIVQPLHVFLLIELVSGEQIKSSICHNPTSEKYIIV